MTIPRPPGASIRCSSFRARPSSETCSRTWEQIKKSNEPSAYIGMWVMVDLLAVDGELQALPGHGRLVRKGRPPSALSHRRRTARAAYRVAWPGRRSARSIGRVRRDRGVCCSRKSRWFAMESCHGVL